MGYRVDASRAEPYALPGPAPLFAPPAGETGPSASETCRVMPGGTAVDDGRSLLAPPDRVTVRPLGTR